MAGTFNNIFKIYFLTEIFSKETLEINVDDIEDSVLKTINSNITPV